MNTLTDKEAYKLGYNKGFEDGTKTKPVKKLYLSTGEPVLEIVCDAVDENIEQVRSSSRKRELVTARKIYCYLCDKHTTLSLRSIGQTMKRDHTTVIHNLDEAYNAIETDSTFRSLLIAVERIFSSKKSSIPQEKKRSRPKTLKRAVRGRKIIDRKKEVVKKIEPFVRAKADHTNNDFLSLYEQKYKEIEG